MNNSNVLWTNKQYRNRTYDTTIMKTTQNIPAHLYKPKLTSPIEQAHLSKHKHVHPCHDEIFLKKSNFTMEAHLKKLRAVRFWLLARNAHQRLNLESLLTNRQALLNNINWQCTCTGVPMNKAKLCQNLQQQTHAFRHKKSKYREMS